MSGMRYWSLSAIRVKPSTEEPSNHVPCRTEPSSWWIGIVTALTAPMMSVNSRETNRIPLALGDSICSTPDTAPSAATTDPAYCAHARYGPVVSCTTHEQEQPQVARQL